MDNKIPYINAVATLSGKNSITFGDKKTITEFVTNKKIPANKENGQS